MDKLVDLYKRKFVYLRLSITDRCNFRCVYCLPNGYQGTGSNNAELSVDEIRRLVHGFTLLGIQKVRLTGGEPTLRRELIEIASAISSMPEIKKLAITTNGHRLKELGPQLKKAGVTSINVSLDSLDSNRFNKITGVDRFHNVFNAVEGIASLGFESIKINAVLLKDANSDELGSFTDWIRNRNISVRFIELMRTGNNEELFRLRHLSGETVKLSLLENGWQAAKRKFDDGPAVLYEHPEYLGTIGIIAPYSKGFCDTCNRLRVSSRGALRLCLFGDSDAPLRQYLQSDDQREELAHEIQRLTLGKEPSHYLQKGNYGNTWNLSAIGG